MVAAILLQVALFPYSSRSLILYFQEQEQRKRALKKEAKMVTSQIILSTGF